MIPFYIVHFLLLMTLIVFIGGTYVYYRFVLYIACHHYTLNCIIELYIHYTLNSHSRLHIYSRLHIQDLDVLFNENRAHSWETEKANKRRKRQKLF